MPTYSFLCPNCGTRFDWVLKVDDRDNPVSCPSCRSVAKRVPALNRGPIIWSGMWHDPSLRASNRDELGPDRGF